MYRKRERARNDPVHVGFLPTVLAGRTLPNGRKRIEPDFMVMKDGVVMVVEVDGQFTHRETPLKAHEREAVFRDEGVQFTRVGATNSPESASAAVNRVLATIQRVKEARR